MLTDPVRSMAVLIQYRLLFKTLLLHAGAGGTDFSFTEPALPLICWLSVLAIFDLPGYRYLSAGPYTTL